MTRGGHSHRRCSHSCDRGQGLFLVSVKQSRIIFKLGNSGQDVYILRVHIAHSVCDQMIKVLFAVQSSGQATKKMVKIFLDPSRSCDYSTYGSDVLQYTSTCGLTKLQTV